MTGSASLASPKHHHTNLTHNKVLPTEAASLCNGDPQRVPGDLLRPNHSLAHRDPYQSPTNARNTFHGQKPEPRVGSVQSEGCVIDQSYQSIQTYDLAPSCGPISRLFSGAPPHEGLGIRRHRGETRNQGKLYTLSTRDRPKQL